MKILGIESSAKAASVSITDNGVLLAQYFQASGLTHSRTLLLMVENILRDTGLTTDQLDAIAVANGPGSFTGVRIGVSAAKGLALGADKPVIPVSTLEAMVHQCLLQDVIICPVMDARRAQVYNAVFKLSDNKLERLSLDRAISIEELERELTQYDKPICLIGDGAELCYRTLDNEALKLIMAPQPIRLQAAYGVCAAAEHSTPISGEDIVPNYLRLSQAERERLEKNK